MTNSTDTKLQELVDQYGYDCVEDMLADAIVDSVCPAICMNEGCDYTTDMEPDQNRGWCDACEENSMKSVLVLMGMI